MKYGWDNTHDQLAQLVEQWTGVPRVVGSSPTPGTNTFLPNVTLLVSEVIIIIYLKHQPETPKNLLMPNKITRFSKITHGGCHFKW